MHKLVIATHNQGKLLEYRQPRSIQPLEVVSLDDLHHGRRA